MPIYEYRCGACGERFETLASPSPRNRKPAVRCPSCGGADAERLWSRVAVGTDRKGYHRAEPLDV